MPSRAKGLVARFSTDLSSARARRYSPVVRGAYRLVDAPGLDVVSALIEAFGDEGLPFAIAGGMGVQALLASAGLEHLLRRTGDVGVIVAADDASVVRALNVLASSHSRLAVVQNPAARNARVGPMSVDWINEPSRLKGLEHEWRGSIDRARFVRVRRLELPVQEPEVLLAAKLTGQKVRPQDELDIAGVIQSGTPIDEARLRSFVSARPGRWATYLAIKDRVPQD